MITPSDGNFEILCMFLAILGLIGGMLYLIYRSQRLVFQLEIDVKQAQSDIMKAQTDATDARTDVIKLQTDINRRQAPFGGSSGHLLLKSEYGLGRRFSGAIWAELTYCVFSQQAIRSSQLDVGLP